ncbi:MAG: hypothetical protein ABFD61_03385 [Chloroherpetonaceae bacterium]|nr:hypothetical protein [bacterium]
METTNIPRNYKPTDSELCMFTSNLCNTMMRDLYNIARSSITAKKILIYKYLGITLVGTGYKSAFAMFCARSET